MSKRTPMVLGNEIHVGTTSAGGTEMRCSCGAFGMVGPVGHFVPLVWGDPSEVGLLWKTHIAERAAELGVEARPAQRAKPRTFKVRVSCPGCGWVGVRPVQEWARRSGRAGHCQKCGASLVMEEQFEEPYEDA